MTLQAVCRLSLKVLSIGRTAAGAIRVCSAGNPLSPPRLSAAAPGEASTSGSEAELDEEWPADRSRSGAGVASSGAGAGDDVLREALARPGSKGNGNGENGSDEPRHGGFPRRAEEAGSLSGEWGGA